MLYRVRDAAGRAVFNKAAAGVLAAPPVEVRGEDRLAIVSQLRSKDLLPWLVAIKSLYARLGRGGVIVVDDGSLTPSDRAVITDHVVGAEVMPLSAGRVPGLPEGGTWERLCVIAREARERYVMQLDADTVTVGRLDAVAALIDANRPFAIADAGSPGPCGFAAFSDFHKARGVPPSEHIQIAAEMALDTVGLPTQRLYLRGSSAFAGFPAGADVLPLLHEFHDAMSARLGERWREWGSEQVASNYAVANIGEAALLTPPTFANHNPNTDVQAASLLHFYGTFRHYRGRYAAAAKRAIAAL